MKHLLYPLFFILTVLFSACDPQRVYENHLDIDENNWKKEDTLSFDFEIKDAVQSYNLYYDVRYSNEYPFYNLFTRYFIYDSTGKLIKTPSLPEDMYLFDMKTGEPYGKGIATTYDQRISFLQDYIFPIPGRYVVKVAQYMRKDPLPGIKAFGIRVEKTAK